VVKKVMFIALTKN